MKISYAGDHALAVHFTQMAQQEFFILKSRPNAQGRFVKTFRNAWGMANVMFTIGNGMDGVHIIAQSVLAALTDGQAPRFFSGAVVDQGYLADGLLCSYAPTSACVEQYSYKTTPLISSPLAIKAHASMPSRLSAGLADSQYTTQQSSKYTGMMCMLVQVILSYGKLAADANFASAIKAFKDSQGKGLVLPKSVLITPGNASGVQNTFGFEWARTTGVYTYNDPVGNQASYWLINISTTFGVQAMPLQIEPITATSQFRNFIVAELNKTGAKKYLRDVKAILDTFGGFPSNEAFLTTEDSIKAQIVTLLAPSEMPQYVNGKAVSDDHGWAFNRLGTCANTVCLEEFNNSWHMAHHCQVSIGYDSLLKRPTATFAVLESGSAPIGKHYLKVGSTTLDACVSYNLALLDQGDYAGRPKATRTAMFVFWKNDRLEALRWSDGHIETIPATTETTQTRIGDLITTHYVRETWSGSNGLAAGFFCTLHDGRIPTTDYHYRQEYTTQLANERQRVVAMNPATDGPEWYSRNFWTWRETRTETTRGDRTDDCCAFIPLGDRSAFYIATMTTTGTYEDKMEVEVSTLGDPYAYGVSDTYLWNWDFGTRIGEKYPLLVSYIDTDGVTKQRVFLDGIVNVVWDRSGAKGKAQLDHYGQWYINGPSFYKGGYSYLGWTEGQQAQLDAWTEFTGRAEWMTAGEEPAMNSPVQAFSGSPVQTYNTTLGGVTTLSVYFISMQEVSEVFHVSGSYVAIYRDYNYWFDRSPNTNGDFQTVWAFKNCLGDKFYQLYSVDVNNRSLAANGGYALPTSNFPTFIGVVGEIPA